MNKAILIGNLCKSPELKTTSNGVSVCTFRVAVRRPRSTKDESDFINIVAWRSLGENCAKWLKKGNKVGIVGSIQTREYDDNNGVRRYQTEIVADDIDFLTPKDSTMPQKSEDRDAPPPDQGIGLFDEGEFEIVDDDQMPF